MNFLQDLKDRGLLKDQTAGMAEPKFQDKPKMYAGFDPTSDSLHAGSLIPLLGLDRFRQQGGQVIILIGGATGLIGDPSGKSAERPLQALEKIKSNTAALEEQIRDFFAKTPGLEPVFVNNMDWYKKMDIISFLRDVGKHFPLQSMLNKDSVQSRLGKEDGGMSFTEFSYQLLQGYDFLHLFSTTGCQWQLGASDQWGNIVAGVDLVRKVTGKPVHGITLPLLTNAAGKKYGKSETGTAWLDQKKTSPFAFYQFWLNSTDEDAPRFCSWLTDGPIPQLDRKDPRALQAYLAFSLTSRVHGAELATRARQASAVLFSSKFSDLDVHVANMLSYDVPTWTAEAGMPITPSQALLGLKAFKSRGDIRRLQEQGALKVNGMPVVSIDQDLQSELQDKGALIISAGKTSRYLLRLATQAPSAKPSL